MSEQKVVLITGVSSGIGQAIAQSLVKRGFTAFGTSRNPSGVATMPGLEVLPLDVCLDESVKACVDAVVKRVGRLDILVKGQRGQTATFNKPFFSILLRTFINS